MTDCTGTTHSEQQMAAIIMAKPRKIVSFVKRKWTERGGPDSSCPQCSGRTQTLGMVAMATSVLGILFSLFLASVAFYDGHVPYDPSLPPLFNVSSDLTPRPWCHRGFNFSVITNASVITNDITNHSVVVVGDDGGVDGVVEPPGNGTSVNVYDTWDLQAMAVFWQVAMVDNMLNMPLMVLYLAVPHPLGQVAASLLLLISTVVMSASSLWEWQAFPLTCYPDATLEWGAWSLMTCAALAYMASVGCWYRALRHALNEIDRLVEAPLPSRRRRSRRASSSSRRRSFYMRLSSRLWTTAEYRRLERVPLLA